MQFSFTYGHKVLYIMMINFSFKWIFYLIPSALSSRLLFVIKHLLICHAIYASNYLISCIYSKNWNWIWIRNAIFYHSHHPRFMVRIQGNMNLNTMENINSDTNVGFEKTIKPATKRAPLFDYNLFWHRSQA